MLNFYLMGCGVKHCYIQVLFGLGIYNSYSYCNNQMKYIISIAKKEIKLWGNHL